MVRRAPACDAYRTVPYRTVPRRATTQRTGSGVKQSLLFRLSISRLNLTSASLKLRRTLLFAMLWKLFNIGLLYLHNSAHCTLYIGRLTSLLVLTESYTWIVSPRIQIYPLFSTMIDEGHYEKCVSFRIVISFTIMHRHGPRAGQPS